MPSIIRITATAACLWTGLSKNGSHGFGGQEHLPLRHPMQGSSTHLYAIRRPLRPASTEKKRAERRAIIESRQNEALQDPTLLTNQSFAKCKEIHDRSKRALVEDMGLQTMTEVQAKTFNAALLGKDVLARARTGTG